MLIKTREIGFCNVIFTSVDSTENTTGTQFWNFTTVTYNYTEVTTLNSSNNATTDDNSTATITLPVTTVKQTPPPPPTYVASTVDYVLIGITSAIAGLIFLGTVIYGWCKNKQ